MAHGHPSRRGLPRAAVLVIVFEFFERFGFYTVLSVLALFLAAAPDRGGMGWSQKSALGFLGVFSALIYVLPAPGGLMADRLLGHRRAVIIGGVLMLAGYTLLATKASDAPLLYAALMLVVLGNALVKSTLAVIFGDCFGDEATARSRGYGLYYMTINLGGAFAGVVAGLLVARFGWWAAFVAAATGMASGLCCFIFAAPRFKAAHSTPRAVAKFATADSRMAVNLGVLGIFAFFQCCLSIGLFQLWGTISLFLDHDVDRRIGRFFIPTPWFTSMDAMALIISAPMLSMFWAMLARRNREPNGLGKLAVSLALVASSFLLLSILAPSGGERPIWCFPAFAITLLAVAEIVAWTTAYDVVYRLAPRVSTAAIMGIYYAATLGIGGYIAGYLGRFALVFGYGRYFLVLGLATLFSALAAIVCSRPLFQLTARQGISLGH